MNSDTDITERELLALALSSEKEDERLQAAVARLREQGERLHALDDGWPAAADCDAPTRASNALWASQYRRAFLDYTVALNCVQALLVEAPHRAVAPILPDSR